MTFIERVILCGLLSYLSVSQADTIKISNSGDQLPSVGGVRERCQCLGL